jgi:capsular polysaccharide transport system permease protein
VPFSRLSPKSRLRFPPLPPMSIRRKFIDTARYVYQKSWLQFRVVNAIAQRELRLRAAKGVMGIASVFVEPLVLILTFVLLRVFIRASASADYINPILWLALGFIPFFMFSDVALKALGGVSKSSDLYFYRRIKPLDTLLANALLTTQIFGVLMLVIMAGVFIWEWSFPVESLGLLISWFIIISVLGFGVGLNTLIVGHRLPILAWFMKMTVRRVLLWTSCIFFPISFIPDQFRGWILWNPLAHGVELMRHSLNPAYPIPGVSIPYFVFSSFGLLGLSFLIYGNNEDLLLADSN